MSDLIKREDAIECCLNGWNKDHKEIVAEIRNLDSVKVPEELMIERKIDMIYKELINTQDLLFKAYTDINDIKVHTGFYENRTGDDSK